MCLTTLLNGSVHVEFIRKVDLQKMKVNDTKIRKVHVYGYINFILEKNGVHRPSSLGGRSIVVVNE